VKFFLPGWRSFVFCGSPLAEKDFLLLQISFPLLIAEFAFFA